MKYVTPFYAISKALFQSLSNADQNLQWFDASVPIDEIENYFRNQSEFAYGIFGASDADCSVPESLPMWTSNVNLEIYSNYKGRLKIAKYLENVMNYLSSDEGYQNIGRILYENGFVLARINVGQLSINLPMYSADVGVWQSGTMSLSLTVTQKESEE